MFKDIIQGLKEALEIEKRANIDAYIAERAELMVLITIAKANGDAARVTELYTRVDLLDNLIHEGNIQLAKEED